MSLELSRYQLREALLEDIPQVQYVRHAVRENVLSNPALVTDADVADYITRRGKGWVVESDGAVIGFAIADLEDDNVWALFVHPDHEGNGIGSELHGVMLDWYFAQGKELLWLGTEPGTRAEEFYRLKGWVEVGVHGKGEVKFEMRAADWKRK